MHAEPPLSPQEAALFPALVKPAVVYLLMLRLGRPTGAREVAGMLGIHEQTAAKYLEALSRLNLVARVAHKNGYVLLGVHQLVKSEGDQAQSTPQLEPPSTLESVGDDLESPLDDATVRNSGVAAQTMKNSHLPSSSPASKNSQHPAGTLKISQNSVQTVKKSPFTARLAAAKISQNPLSTDPYTSRNSGYPTYVVKISQDPLNTVITTTGIKLIKYINDSVVVGGFKGHAASKESQNGAVDQFSEIWRELRAAGISTNHRTRALARLPHITPEYVRAHRLKLEEGGKGGPSWTGLLVTILESGEPAPALNPGGHLASCKCPQCHRYSIAQSWARYT